MERVVEPELIEALPSEDPRAARSRRDLQRFHRMAFLRRVWTRWLQRLGAGFVPKRMIELGAGDGLQMLSFAESQHMRWPGVELILLDQAPVVSDDTLAGFDRLGWKVNVVEADAFCWLNKGGVSDADLIVAHRFLHHFTQEELEFLLVLIAARTRHFFACEPRRSWIQLMAANLYSRLGCNAVTRHDMVRCVQSGFTGDELSRLWPRESSWRLREGPSGLCCHTFLAASSKARPDRLNPS